jgi:hypothetical protein
VLQALKCSVLGDYLCTSESTLKLNIGGAWHNRNHCAVRDNVCLLTPTYSSMFRPFSTGLFFGGGVILTKLHHSCLSHLHILNCTQKFLVNKAKLVHSFFTYVYFFSVHVSGDRVPIIRRNNCIYATLGTCYSVWMMMMMIIMGTQSPETCRERK